jgi:5'-nucleotidase
MAKETNITKKQIVYVDMDDVLCEYKQGHESFSRKFPGIKYPQSIPGFYLNLADIDYAIWGINTLAMHFDVWILTRPSYMNPLCYTEKRKWVENYLGIGWCKKLILCPDKSLMKGDYLIDDQPWPEFEGQQYLFGSDEYPDWESITMDLANEEIII